MKLSEEKSGKARLKPAELSVFCTQISLFLHAGVTLSEGLALLQEDIRRGPLRTAVDGVYRAVQEQRQTLSAAMSHGGAFPPYLVKMAKIGELSGNLELIMQMLAGYYEREQELQRKIAGAVIYPAVLSALMIAVIALLIVKILPMFAQLLSSLGGSMPGFVAGLMSFGAFLGRYWWQILLVISAAAAAVWLLGRVPSVRAGWDRFLASFILTRGLMRKIAAERFSTAMAFLLKSDIEMDTALELCADIVGNAYISGRINETRRMTMQGQTLHEAVYEAGVFPRLFTRMLAIGLKTGDTDQVMEHLSEIYLKEVNHSLKKTMSLIEPVFVGILSVIVGIILLSVMLPMIQIMGAI